MGIRSPRLLERLARRIVAACVLALGFAPSAFAGTGPLPPLASDSVSAPVSAPQLPALPAGAKLATITASLSTPPHLTVPAVTSSSSPSPKPTPGPAPVIAARKKHVHVLSSHTRGAPAQGKIHATPFRQLTTLPASTTARPKPRTSRARLLPLQTPSGIAGTTSSLSASAITLLVFVLAAALAALAAPRLGRRVQLFVRAPRPYLCLLALERPD